MNEISLKSYGKINIFLHVLGKRSDGFHELFTLFSKIALHDTLNIKKSVSQRIVCSKKSIPTDDSNIINRVHKILTEKHGVTQNFETELIKRIPDGGGLGGGSSNGAAYLNGVCDLLELEMSMSVKTSVMASVGSDTAFFLHDEPMIGRGRGEILEPYGSLPECALVLVNPKEHVPTGTVFTSGNLKLTHDKEVNRMRHISDYEEYGDVLFNGLEEAVFKLYPAVEEAKSSLLDAGADFALMSGSGATVFGICRDKGCASRTADMIKSRHPAWDVFITELI
ncbi:4-diphosphocytidyl-2C-methyl-D-erythritolkinase [Denitrovibrio acetiphilus DSM 12809]|uniref:4-diphosphocytidyl-2-C-methyl-D-erythritol kinase n=1 Tax=Denitrovibrio acetiphilus (strain DSM 12809 / NBRC 114555 / N2460) TaxID=522772 RepID=D4H1C7_DENA2|nr:4-(cytidine 5'-diphospho)-2-C-methyl-D-erythritol kinase [Denitrovibrio acetiphilus]ADD66875.1 4-diphosphocytidyl-2C-methyl-D-erythritolkinase [Denitrovibrio acetiphilus DSM 12809]